MFGPKNRRQTSLLVALTYLFYVIVTTRSVSERGRGGFGNFDAQSRDKDKVESKNVGHFSGDVLNIQNQQNPPKCYRHFIGCLRKYKFCSYNGWKLFRTTVTFGVQYYCFEMAL